MKLKKIISAVCAFAMAASFITVANAASLGGKPTVTAEFVEYTTNSSNSWAKAWVKVTIDTTAAETLAAYKEGTVYDEEEEDDVIVKSGNGITTLGGQVAVNNVNFVPQATNNTIPSTWVHEAKTEYHKLAFGPKTVASEYYTEGKTELLLNFKVSSAYFAEDAAISFATMTIDGTCVDVYNVTNNNSTWSYSQAASTIIVEGCSIPSYNEWSTPAEKEEFEKVTGEQSVVGTRAEAGKYEGKYLKHIATVLENSALSKYISISDGTETRVSTRTVAEILGGISVNNTSVSGKLAIGVLTDNPDAVFTFKLVAPVAE